MGAHNHFRNHFKVTLRGLILAWIAIALAAPLLAGDTLDLKPLPERKLTRLTKEARDHYDLAWKALDTINYPLALDELKLSVAAEPDNIYLRELTAKMAIYLGGITSQKESQDNYDRAIEDLTVILNSPQINNNQKAKVANTLKLTTDLRNAVFERDEMRTKYGEGFVKAQKDAKAAAVKKKTDAEAKAKADKLKKATMPGQQGPGAPANDPEG